MAKGMWSYIRSLFSCKRHVELASLNIDRKLDKKERFSYLFHRNYCILCRRFERQLNLIQSRAKAIDELQEKSGECLSAEQKARIAEGLRKG